MYRIINWDTGEVISEWKALPTAKRYCRGEGHTGEGNGVWFNPVAWVADEDGNCVYNPRFQVGFGNAAGALIGTFDDHLR